MAAEVAEAAGVFARAAGQAVPVIDRPRAIYTIARGSSDAAANILSYELMRQTGLPVTTLPPSVFSLGDGVDVAGALVLVISQSGASGDLIAAARGARARGAQVVAITNVPGSGVELAADLTLPIGAGPERAVPATKTVVGAVGAGLALTARLAPGIAAAVAGDMAALAGGVGRAPGHDGIVAALVGARHVYVIGRDCGFGAAQELALKIKETCAVHAEAYSASEVLHGPMQLATRGLTILMLDTGQVITQASLDLAEARLTAAGGRVWRVRLADLGVQCQTGAAAAAALLTALYPVVLDAALQLGHDPDAPATLSKVTLTT